MRIVFVTAEGDEVLVEDVDRPFHEASFGRHGVGLEYRYWSDPEVDWSSYDLMVIRSTWDYALRPVEFVEWLDSVAELPALVNSASLVRWNLDKRYLIDLSDRGVPIVETAIVESMDDFEQCVARSTASEIVVKPVVSAGSRLTGWYLREDPRARELAREILAENNCVIVEPFISSVARGGEISVVLFDGEFSHALRKGPLLEKGGGLLGGVYTESITGHEPSDAERALAEQANDAVVDLAFERGWLSAGQAPLYARFDMVELDDKSVAIIEVELFEPSFFLSVSEGAPDRFTLACMRRVRQLGLG